MVAPSFRENEIFVKDDGQRYLVRAVGEEAYFLRRLDARPGEVEPRESAWAFKGAEAGVRRRVAAPTMTVWGGYQHHADQAFGE